MEVMYNAKYGCIDCGREKRPVCTGFVCLSTGSALGLSVSEKQWWAGGIRLLYLTVDSLWPLPVLSIYGPEWLLKRTAVSVNRGTNGARAWVAGRGGAGLGGWAFLQTLRGAGAQPLRPGARYGLAREGNPVRSERPCEERRSGERVVFPVGKSQLRVYRQGGSRWLPSSPLLSSQTVLHPLPMCR